MVEVHNILKYAEKSGAQEAEILTDHTRFTYARFESGEPQQTLVGDITEYAVRVRVDHALGFAYFTDNWQSAVKKALSLAEKGYQHESCPSFVTATPPTPLHLSDPSIGAVTLDVLISDLTDGTALIDDPRILAHTGSAHVAHSTAEIASTSGAHQVESSTLASARMACRAYETDYGIGAAQVHSLAYDIDIEGVCEKAQHDALAQLGKEPPHPGKKQVILSPRVCANLLVCAAVPSFLGHNVEEGRSALTCGDTVAAHHLQLTETPLTHGPQGRSFDDEGMPSQSVELISDGTVDAFLYDRYYGQSTGSGIRYGQYRGRTLKEPPLPCATSLFLRGSSSPLEEMISSVDDGLMVIDETNSHASKSQSGLFSIAVTSGFEIKKGEITGPVNRCMISGLAFEDFLPNVTCISTERELHRSFVYPTYVDTGYVLVDGLRITA